MALGAVLAAALTNHAYRPRILTVDGVDVLAAPDKTFGVPIESVTVNEQGPGQVSSMTFTVEDPTGVYTAPASGHVVFWDVAHDVPIFDGFVEDVSVEVLGIGKQVTISAVGIEALLDWSFVPPVLIPAGLYLQDGYAKVVAAAYVPAPIRVAYTIGGFSTITAPAMAPSRTFTSDLTTTAGTLRAVLTQLNEACLSSTDPGVSMTVDYHGNLRTYSNDAPPLDWDGVVLDVGTVTQRPADVRSGLNVSARPRAVYVQGATAAGSGVFSDGSGIPGPTASISRPSTDAAGARIYATFFLAGLGDTYDGQAVLEGMTAPGSPGNEVRAGEWITFTLPQVGNITYGSRIQCTSITKTFYPSGEERWVVTWGGTIKRGSLYLRQLTKTTLI